MERSYLSNSLTFFKFFLLSFLWGMIELGENVLITPFFSASCFLVNEVLQSFCFVKDSLFFFCKNFVKSPSCANCGKWIIYQVSLGTAYRNKPFHFGNLYLNYNEFLQVVGSLAQPLSLTDGLTSVPWNLIVQLALNG